MRLIPRATLASLLLLPSLAIAQGEDPVEDPVSESAAAERRASFYRTPRERREAGLKTKLTDWITFSGLVEVEAGSVVYQFRNDRSDSRTDDMVPTAQIGFIVEVSDNAKSEIILEFEEDSSESNLDEAIIELENGGWGLATGLLYVPFGIYYSHFITGPLLEFGETRETALMLSYDYHDIVEVGVFVSNGEAEEIATDGRIEDRISDWGAAIETELINNRLELGASYLSDLADTDELLLDEVDNLYQRRVDGWSAYAVMRPGKWDISLEFLAAARSFRDLAPDADEPRAWNVEIAYFPRDTWELAARMERSDELADQPERQYGIAANWLAFQTVSVSLEYLRADYKPGFAFDIDGNEFERRNLVAVRLSMEF